MSQVSSTQKGSGQTPNFLSRTSTASKLDDIVFEGALVGRKGTKTCSICLKCSFRLFYWKSPYVFCFWLENIRSFPIQGIDHGLDMVYSIILCWGRICKWRDMACGARIIWVWRESRQRRSTRFSLVSPNPSRRTRRSFGVGVLFEVLLQSRSIFASTCICPHPLVVELGLY